MVAWFKVLTCILLSLNAIVARKELNLGMLIPWTSTYLPGNTFAGAITRVIDDVNNDSNLLPNTTLTFSHRNTYCDGTVGLGGAVDLYNIGIDVYIGPACSAACLSSGMLSTFKKIPMISYGCSSIHLSDKKEYPYFARTKPFARGSKEWTPKTFVALANYFNWKTICQIERVHEIYTPLVTATKAAFEKNNITIAKRVFYYTDDSDFNDYKTLLEKIKDDCRIVFLLTRARDVMSFMVQAYNLGMSQSKQYAFVSVDFAFGSKWNYASLGYSENFIKSVITRGLITVSAIRPNNSESAYEKFLDDVRYRVKQPPFNDTRLENKTSIVTSAAYLYDATMLYVKAVDQMMKENKSDHIGDAAYVFKYMTNTSFEGFTGPVHIDKNGDRIPLFNIDNVNNGKLVTVATYNPLNNKSIEMIPNEVIVFPGNTTYVPKDVPYCGFDHSKCLSDDDEFNYIPVAIATPILLTMLIFAGVYIHNKKKYEMSILCKGLIVYIKDISFGGENSSFRSKISAMSSLSNFSRRKSELFTTGHFYTSGMSQVVVYRSEKVFLKTVKQSKIELSRDVLIQLKHLKDLNNPNVNPFIGVVSNGPDLHLIWTYCTKGSLQDVLQNDDIECDWMFRLSFANDIAKGLYEIQRSPVGVHGNLSSSNCLVDNRWVCKLSNFGVAQFMSGLPNQPENAYGECRKKFWWSPERLEDRQSPPNKESDIYAYGIILYELYTRGDPYSLEMENDDMQPRDVIEFVKSRIVPPYRPLIEVDDDAPKQFTALMQACWKDLPTERPSVKEITRTVYKMNKENELGGSLVDHMLIMMEKYTDNLEVIVASRTVELEKEKEKTETLLYKMLPKAVANKLKEGQPVLAEHFDAVTIFFSDIVGFTKLCSRSSPLQVVEMLNDLYSCFDNCVDSYDVYKVETIGDAYMVVSGLPILNGDNHAGEIATMSLDLLSCVKSFKIRHAPTQQLQLRIGIHTGSCVAGVVGLKMPRYCLFGDTVNYASRMESSGLALRVHVSPECKNVLDTLEGYELEERGPVEMKGKGTILTYFLQGKKGFKKELPDLSLAAGLESHTFK